MLLFGNCCIKNTQSLEQLSIRWNVLQGIGAQIAVYPLMMMGLGVRDDARYRSQIPPRNLFPLSHSSRKLMIYPRHC